MQQDNLRSLLRAVIDSAGAGQGGTGAQVAYDIVASLRSTEDGTAEMGGVTVQVVKGKRVGGDRVQPYYVGQVPGGVPQPEFWTAQFLDLPSPSASWTRNRRPSPPSPTPAAARVAARGRTTGRRGGSRFQPGRPAAWDWLSPGWRC